MNKICGKCKQENTGKHGAYCPPCFRAYMRDWYQKNREKEIARSSAYNKANPDVPAASMRRLRQANHEKYLEYTRQWRRNNPQLAAIYDANKRAKRRVSIDATVRKITSEEWEQIKRAYKHHCAYCLKPSEKLTMDHVIPLSRGGNHEASNIVPACQHCNSAKNAKDVFRFTAEKFGRLL